ncbi:prenylcysteine oxidase 1-like [Hemiscyllium ocellatum]|uniref:prenylcysteine oxidase 1-like n=1 Tax=Hemiscyllium ocellatum TaxID=170820 RepID=UPI0029676993|nr:prenylcysteine oxidase 1-like [Hemiscyllium ocellatum]
MTPDGTSHDLTEAVVGAGVSGCSSARFLRQVFGSGVPIDVYESESVGGTMATAWLNGQEYEMGEEVCPEPGSEGEEVVFEESKWFLVNIVKLLWRYGLDYIRTKGWLDAHMHNFLKIYQLQARAQCSRSAERLLQEAGGLDLAQLTQLSISDALREVGIGQLFLDEMVTPIVRLTYGQDTNVSAFAGMMALTAVHSDLWAVEGGNKLLCSGLLYSAKVNLIKGKVTAITSKRRLLRTGEELLLYELSYEDGPGHGYGLYDIVVVTAGEISGSGGPTVRRQPRVVTLVDGCLNTSSFGRHSPDSLPDSLILTASRSPTTVMATMVTRGVRSLPDPLPQPPCARTWRLLSAEPLTRETLDHLFPSVRAVRQSRWLSGVPNPIAVQRHPSFAVHGHLYRLSPSEGATGTAELAVIWAQNAAMLAHRRWHRGSEREGRSVPRGSLRLEL